MNFVFLKLRKCLTHYLNNTSALAYETRSTDTGMGEGGWLCTLIIVLVGGDVLSIPSWKCTPLFGTNRIRIYINIIFLIIYYLL